MLCDADTHFVPFMVYEKIDPALLARKRYHQAPRSVDPVWKKFYDDVKDPSWPDCDLVSDFVNLPPWIRQEIKTLHRVDYIYISDQLDDIFVVDTDDPYPALDDVVGASKHLLKTDFQVLNAQSMENLFTYHSDRSTSIEFAHIFNDCMLQLCQSNPRFHAPLWLPMQNLEDALDLLDHYKDHRFFGVHLFDHHPWGYVQGLLPVWEQLASMNMPVYLHQMPIGTHHEDMPFHWNLAIDDSYDVLAKRWLSQRYLMITAGFSDSGIMEFIPWVGRWMVCVLSFIYSGVLDRLPNLKIIATEFGITWVPCVRQWCMDQGLRDPLPYFKNNFFFTVDPERPEFLQSARLLGFERLLYATDWPHQDYSGANRLKDYACMNQFVQDREITQSEYDLVTYQNYQKILHRFAI